MDEFDDDYVRRLRAGDPRTVAHFDRYFRALMTAMLRRRRISPMAIEDIIQTVLFRVWERLDRIEDGRKLGAFVKGFLDNVLKEHIRLTVRTEQIDPDRDEPDPVDFEKNLHVEILKRQVREALSELEKESPEDVALLRAVYLDEEDRDEVGRRLGLAPDNLRLRLFRARKKFLEIWREWSKRRKH